MELIIFIQQQKKKRKIWTERCNVFDVSWLEGYGYLMIMMISHSLKGS